MKKKIFIISASYPYGKGETFLENEVNYLSNFFDIEIFPIYYNANRSCRKVQANVKYHKPFIPKNLLLRLFKSLFIFRFFKIEIPELVRVFKEGQSLRYNLKAYLISVTNLRFFYTSIAFKKIYNEDNNSIVYFYWSSSLNLIIDLIKIKTLVRVHGGELELERHKGYIPFISKSISVDTLFLPISLNTQKTLKYLNNNSKSIINRLGTWNDKYILNDSVEIKAIHIVSCSNLIKLKRVHLIIEALQKCQNIDVKWVHFGDGILMDELKKKAKEKLKYIKYQFMGFVSNDFLLNYYRVNKVDLFVNVSETEGVPVSIMEAMSFGIPCFATNVGATSEIVNQENGVLVNKSFNLEELVLTIENCKSLIFKRKRKIAYNTWKKNYNAGINYKELKKIIENKL